MLQLKVMTPNSLACAAAKLLRLKLVEPIAIVGFKNQPYFSIDNSLDCKLSQVTKGDYKHNFNLICLIMTFNCDVS